MQKSARDFVVGFIKNSAGTRIGLKVYNLDTEKLSDVALPVEGTYLNVYVRDGKLTSKYVSVSEFPEFIGEKLGACQPGVKGAATWVLKDFGDGRVKLLSFTGQTKIVTKDTALGYHNMYGIVGCSVVGNKLDVPTHDYTEMNVAPVEAPKPAVKPVEQKPNDSESILMAALREAVKSLAKLDLNKDDVESEIGEYYSYVTVRLYIGAYDRLNYVTATHKLNGAVEKLTEALKPKYGAVDLSGETSGDGYCTLILGLDEKVSRTTPVVKAPAAKAPVAKAPVAKAPVAKAPVAKAPVAKAPVAKAPVAMPAGTPNSLAGLTFCITGKVKYPGSRAGLQAYIASLGGNNATTVGKGVDYLITNDAHSGSTKNQAAQKLGCKVISEDDLLRMASAVPKDYKKELIPVITELLKHITSKPMSDSDYAYEEANDRASITANLRSSTYANMSHMAATDELCGTIEYYEEKLQETYPGISIGCDIGEKGHYSVTVSKAM